MFAEAVCLQHKSGDARSPVSLNNGECACCITCITFVSLSCNVMLAALFETQMKKDHKVCPPGDDVRDSNTFLINLITINDDSLTFQWLDT